MAATPFEQEPSSRDGTPGATDASDPGVECTRTVELPRGGYILICNLVDDDYWDALESEGDETMRADDEVE